MKYFLVTVEFTEPVTFNIYKVTVSLHTTEEFLSTSRLVEEVMNVSGKQVSKTAFSVSFLQELTKREYTIWNS